MARARQVTRTIKTTNALIFVVNTETEETAFESVILPTVYKTQDKLLAAAKEMVETDVIKVGFVKNFTVEENLYSMPEAEFIRHAKIVTKD